MTDKYRFADVSLGTPFEVEVPEGTYDVSVESGQSEHLPAGRYRVLTIRHLVPDEPVTTVEGEQALHSADIWYGIQVADDNHWVRGFACVPVSVST